jgi:hypothetical protein
LDKQSYTPLYQSILQKRTFPRFLNLLKHTAKINFNCLGVAWMLDLTDKVLFISMSNAIIKNIRTTTNIQSLNQNCPFSCLF